jgi:hypothetical protein
VLVLFGAGIGSAQNTLYFAQYVDGSLGGGIGWNTVIAVTNPAALGSAPANATISVRRDDSSPLNVAFVDENGAPLSSNFQLAGGQTILFFSPQTRSTVPLLFNNGFVTVSSNLPLSGTSVFSEFNAQGTFAEGGVPASAPLTRQETIAAKITGSNTALAVANPGAATANIQFQLLDRSGQLMVPQVTRGLIGNNQTAFFVTDLFPTAPASAVGTLRMISDQPVVATALLFSGSAFTTLPIFPIQ